MDEARELFPRAVRIERVTWNGKPCWRIVESVDGREVWHYVEADG